MKFFRSVAFASLALAAMYTGSTHAQETTSVPANDQLLRTGALVRSSKSPKPSGNHTPTPTPTVSLGQIDPKSELIEQNMDDIIRSVQSLLESLNKEDGNPVLAKLENKENLLIEISKMGKMYALIEEKAGREFNKVLLELVEIAPLYTVSFLTGISEKKSNSELLKLAKEALAKEGRGGFMSDIDMSDGIRF